jgi:hypothetical protein
MVDLKDHLVPPLVNNTGYPLALPRPWVEESVGQRSRHCVELRLDARCADTNALSRQTTSLWFSETTASLGPHAEGRDVVNDDKFGMVRFNKRELGSALLSLTLMTKTLSPWCYGVLATQG